MRFSLRSHGPMGEYRFAQMVSSFPWWTVIVAVVGMIVGIYLLQKYDFSYKINSRVMVIGFVFSIILAGWLVDFLGINTMIFRRGRVQEMINPSFQDVLKHQNFKERRF
ncbi:MAG: hypothetical protein ACD_48C00544G0001 [uncultured bacterium]|nr:MAG: hypothetical protein ACD_48C00544G0001 [uncultured bacterium]